MYQSVKNNLKLIFNNNQINSVLTTFMVFICIYVTIISLFHRNFLNPLEIKNDSEGFERLEGISKSQVSGIKIKNDSGEIKDLKKDLKYQILKDKTTDDSGETETLGRFRKLATSEVENGNDSGDSEKVQRKPIDEDYVLTVISIFFLWISALILGKVVKYIFLPPLLGMLIAGILFGNLPWLKDFLIINKFWEEALRKMAFLLILVRAGVGIDPEILKRSLRTCLFFGFGSTAIEMIGITLIAWLFFNLPLGLSLAFSYVLTSTSPAITVPTMIRLQREERGKENGIPTVILASATIDNLHCIAAFYIILGFSSPGEISFKILQVCLELLLSGVFGIGLGFFLRFFPNKENGFFHFFRSTLMISISLAVYYGSVGLGYNIIGPVTVFIMSIMASMKWKYDNPKKTKTEERSFRILWAFVFQPLLFSLIGLLFDFSVFNLKLLQQALVLILVGIIIRILGAFAISFCMGLKLKERLFVSICFFPKATVQAALAPVLASFSIIYSDSAFKELILQTNILSILITAPIGQLMILGLGRMFLSKPDRINQDEVSDIGCNNDAVDVELNDEV